MDGEPLSAEHLYSEHSADKWGDFGRESTDRCGWDLQHHGTSDGHQFASQDCPFTYIRSRYEMTSPSARAQPLLSPLYGNCGIAGYGGIRPCHDDVFP